MNTQNETTQETALLKIQPKDYYLKLIEKVYTEVREAYVRDGKDVDEFDFGVEIDNYYDLTEEVIVGYYLRYYDEEEVLDVWLENTKSSELVWHTDAGVTKILKALFEK